MPLSVHPIPLKAFSVSINSLPAPVQGTIEDGPAVAGDHHLAWLRCVCVCVCMCIRKVGFVNVVPSRISREPKGSMEEIPIALPADTARWQ